MSATITGGRPRAEGAHGMGAVYMKCIISLQRLGNPFKIQIANVLGRQLFFVQQRFETQGYDARALVVCNTVVQVIKKINVGWSKHD